MENSMSLIREQFIELQQECWKKHNKEGEREVGTRSEYLLRTGTRHMICIYNPFIFPIS